MDSAGLFDRLESGAEKEMVGVDQDELSAKFSHLVMEEGLDRSLAGYGSERGGLDDAVPGPDLSRAGGGLGVPVGDGEHLAHELNRK